jgi:hypothetical protein
MSERISAIAICWPLVSVKGRALDDRRGERAGRRTGRPAPAHALAHQRERNLAGQKLVIGEPRRAGACGFEIVGIVLGMQGWSRHRRSAAPFLPLQQLVDPFGQVRHGDRPHATACAARGESPPSADRPARPAAGVIAALASSRAM